MGMEPEKLTFYTDGENFTAMLNGLVECGDFIGVDTLFKKSGTNIPMSRFIEGKVAFSGSTLDGDFHVELLDEATDENWLLRLTLGVRHILRKRDYRIYEINHLIYDRVDDQFNALMDSIGNLDYLIKLLTPGLLRYQGNRLITQDEISSVTDPFVFSNGIILQNGDFISCGFMGHNNLYGLLYALRIVDVDDWLDDKHNIHVTSSQVLGNVISNIEYGLDEDMNTEKQIATLFKLRKYLHRFGSGNLTVSDMLYSHVELTTKMGGKFNGLTYLKTFYPDVKIPQFTANVEDAMAFGDKVFIRTSPKNSLPGLLNSVLVDNNPDAINQAVDKIKSDFNKCLGIHSKSYIGKSEPHDDNEIHVFYQKFIDGSNGVCHVRDGNFTYQMSRKQGDIVSGKIGDETLPDESVAYLKSIAYDIYDSFKHTLLQLEFAYTDSGEVYILQMRLFDSPKLSDERAPESACVVGKSFTSGIIICNVDDILVVDEDCESDKLIGKKALIVRTDVEFSHILALSKVMKIPSIFACSGKLPSSGEVNFNANNIEGFVLSR